MRGRFGQWILDTCRRPYDQQWLDYQEEIALRHHRTKKNRTDGVDAVDHISLRYILAFIYPITATMRPFLENGHHDGEAVDRMHDAWFKAVVLQAILSLTGDGQAAARELSDWAEVVRRQVAGRPADEKLTVLHFLLRLIASLQEVGVVSVARMCVTCRFFGEDEGPDAEAPHYCHLLGAPLPVADLRVDCPEHEPREDAAG